MQYYDSSVYQKIPKLLDYFQKGIIDENKNISHCLLFWGADINLQCGLALEIARLLNCKEGAGADCSCQNCRWIKEQTHPAIKIYTRLDFKETDSNSSEDEDSSKGKKNININQAKSIINELSISSDYHRVYIFCDRYEEGNLLPLNRMNFPEATSNALLKTFEEPPKNTTFIFLTKDKTDVISTVVSRAQSFFVPSLQPENKDYSLVEGIIAGYWNFDKNRVLDIEDELLKLAADNAPEEIFIQMENYMFEILQSNYQNKTLFYRMKEDLKFVEEAMQQVVISKMNIKTVMENLCFKMFLK